MNSNVIRQYNIIAHWQMSQLQAYKICNKKLVWNQNWSMENVAMFNSLKIGV